MQKLPNNLSSLYPPQKMFVWRAKGFASLDSERCGLISASYLTKNKCKHTFKNIKMNPRSTVA